MRADIVELRDFYASSLGHVARRGLRRHLRQLWPDVKGLRVLGVGYAVPYLGVFRGEAERVLAAMPASQGVLPWPASGPGLTVLADDQVLPFPDLSMDRIVMVHALEGAENLRPLMREAWRVLADGGRLIVMVPNRTGLWSRLESTPFGHGRPFSARQLGAVLRDNLFTPLSVRPALFVPPFRSRVIQATAAAWENIGARWAPALGGVLVAEASKTIYAANPVAAERQRAYMPATERQGS